jgi:hypothetical protein
VSNRAQKRAIENYRSRLTKRGIVRFELQALEADRDLFRTLARKLTEEGPEAGHLRRTITGFSIIDFSIIGLGGRHLLRPLRQSKKPRTQPRLFQFSSATAQ